MAIIENELGESEVKFYSGTVVLLGENKLTRVSGTTEAGKKAQQESLKNHLLPRFTVKCAGVIYVQTHRCKKTFFTKLTTKCNLTSG